MRVVAALVISLCIVAPAAEADIAGASPASAWLRFWRLVTGQRPEACPLGDLVAGQAEPGAHVVVVPARKKAWEAALGGEEAARPAVRARLAGWPAQLHVDPASLPGNDRDLVARLAADTWRGLSAFTDRENGLPIDNVRLADTPAAARVGDYTNITSVGLRLVAIVAAHELALVSAPDAVREVRRLLGTLDGLETHDGFFFNYYDTTSRERTSNLISFVDSSWLTAGLMVVRATFPEVAAECSRLIERADYGFFYDRDLALMSHGYWVHLAARSRYHYGMLYAESRLGSLIAIGKGDVPAAHWFRMARTLPGACTWQTQPPRERRRKQVLGHPVVGGYYEWNGVRYVPSWGGSMFEALMPTLVVDEPRWAAHNLGANDLVHAAVQRRYAMEVLGYRVWGLSPSSTPGGGYGEYGVPVLGTVGYGPGAVTPHAAALALAVAPREAIADLRALAITDGLYGDFGLYDAVDPRTGAVAQAYLALDQAMTLVAAANYLNDHCIQRRFAADPIAQRALPLLAAEDFFD